MNQLALHAVAQAIPGAICGALMVRSAAITQRLSFAHRRAARLVAPPTPQRDREVDRVVVAMRRRGPCAHNDQGVDRREESFDA
jgi:hypothetical protein